MNDSQFRCLLVEKLGKDQFRREITSQPLRALPSGDVLVRVSWSSLNYKDALAAQGHPGIVRRFPHIPGIDAAGEVVESSSSVVPVGQQVIVTSFDLGAGQWGGWSEYIRVPAEWVVPLPAGLELRDAMVLGTAGFTAALSVWQLQHNEVRPEQGEVAVTGATGGVGVIAVRLLSHLGYRVVAISGKSEQANTLRALGAADVLSRDALLDGTAKSKPILSARWAGVVDTVGGPLLTSLVGGTQPRGCITVCGMVGGAELELSIYPFILRGVTLAGIDSAWTPRALRGEIWQRLAQPWNVTHSLQSMVHEVPLENIAAPIEAMLQGKHVGRTIVRL